MKTFKAAKAAIGGAVAGITEVGKFVASTFTRKNKSKDNLEEEFAEY